MPKSYWCAGLLALTSLLPLESARAQVAYGAYGHYPIGDTRVLAMGGAFVGLADDASATVTNPAGLSLAKYAVDLTSGQNRIVNREQVFGTGTQAEGIPYTALFKAGAFRWGPVGLGAAYSVPYDVDYDNGGTLPSKRGLKVQSLDLALSVGLFKAVSVGVAAASEKVSVSHTDLTGNKLLSEKEAIHPRVGVLVHVEKAGFGITYTPERRYDIDEGLDLQLPPGVGTSEWFHDVVIPQKITLGMSVKSSDKLKWVGDIDIYAPVKDAIVVGGSAMDPSDKIIESQKTIMHGGFEYTVLKSPKLGFIWRGGGYNEPKRLETRSDRLHYTMGIEARWWIFVVAASYDQAPDFSNVAQSISVTLGEL